MMMSIHAHGHVNPIAEGIATIIAILITGMAMVLRQRDATPQRSPRSYDLEALAKKLGFNNFSPERDYDFVQDWNFLGCFAEGEDRYTFNILEGTYHDQQLFIFDYHYAINSGKNKTDNYLTMLMLVVKQGFPKLTIRPENLLSKIGGAFDAENIKFESAEFSKAFHVRSADKKFAYDVCNPQMIDYLLSNRDLRIEIQGPVILLDFSPELSAGLIEFNLERLAQIRALLPQYLFEQNPNT
jgi:hypothetical protein